MPCTAQTAVQARVYLHSAKLHYIDVEMDVLFLIENKQFIHNIIFISWTKISLIEILTDENTWLGFNEILILLVQVNSHSMRLERYQPSITSHVCDTNILVYK